MNEHRSPRPFIIGILALIILTFLIGTLQAFSSARAASPQRPILNGAALLAPSPTPTATRQATCAPRTFTPSPTPTDAAEAGPRSASTDGIIAFAALMVTIVLFGVLWAGRKPTRRRTSPPEKKKKEKSGRKG